MGGLDDIARELKTNADFDQGLAAMLNFARTVASYHATLVEAGLTRDEALALTLDYQKSVLGAAQGGQS